MAPPPALFPSMQAELIVYPLSNETQVVLLQRHAPPLGVVDGSLDSPIGYRIADTSVHRFATAVGRLLRQELAQT